MKRELFITLRNGRSAIIAWIVTAMMLPVLLTLLPSPATATEQSAYAELQRSLCNPAGERGDPSLPAGNHTEACVLCAAGCNLSGPSAIALPDFELAAPSRPAVKPELLATSGSTITTSALIRPTPPRGPPLLTL